MESLQAKNGDKPVSEELKAKILNAYGYKVTSFRNFSTKDKRAKSVPTKYHLSILMRSFGESDLQTLFEFATGLAQKRGNINYT